MDFDIKFEGLDSLIDRIEKIDDVKPLVSAMYDACDIVEGAAKDKAPKDTGALRRSITSKVEITGNEIDGIVYTPLEYAPYVEYGTGLFAENSPTSGYWVYVRNSSSSSNKPSKRYTLEEAKQVVAIMRSKGLDAVYTNGQHPHPYMRPALQENKDKVIGCIKGALK